MNPRQFLLPLFRALRPVVDGLHLNRLARPIWAALWRRPNGGLIKARQNGRVWRLDPEIALRGAEQEMETICWLRSVVSPGMTVIDVGANVGQMTLEMAHLVGTTGRVVAIEPGPGNLELLRRHVKANGFAERVTIVAAACCAQDGQTMELEIVGQTNDVGSGFQLAGIGLKMYDSRLKTRVSVPTVSLDGLCDRLKIQPRVVKIDVEGSELEALRGATRLLEDQGPAIRFGFHPIAFPDARSAQSEIEAIFAGSNMRVEAKAGKAWALEEINVSKLAPYGP